MFMVKSMNENYIINTGGRIMSTESEKVDGEHRRIKPRHKRTVDDIADRAAWEADHYNPTSRAIEDKLWKQVSGENKSKSPTFSAEIELGLISIKAQQRRIAELESILFNQVASGGRHE